MRTFVVLGAGVDSVPIIRRLKVMGLHITAIDADPGAPGFDVADAHRMASCYDPVASLKAVVGSDVQGVLCAGVDAPMAQCVVAAAWGKPGLSYRTAWLSQDKAAQLSVLVGARLRVPKTVFAWTAGLSVTEAFYEVAGQNGVAIVKPADSRGARGVFRLKPAWSPPHYLADYFARAKEASPTGRVLVQSWVSGIQLSTESIVVGGRVGFTAIAERNYSRLAGFAPHVIEDGSDTPWVPHFSGTGPEPESNVLETLQRCVDAIGLQDGTLKGDLVFDGSTCVIEVATRLSGGGFCSEIVPIAYGMDFVGAAARIAMGEGAGPMGQLDANQHVCQRYIFPDPRPEKHPDRGDYHLGTGKTREEARADVADLLRGR